MSKKIIQLEHIDVTFHQKKQTIKAVRDVTIRINKGDIYGIVGYSGAGKSTLVRVINLLQIPTAGKITVDDDVIFQGDKVRLTPAQLRSKRREIGMIFQHFNLMAQMTAEENVAFALKHAGLSQQEKKEKVARLLELVGLSDRAKNYPAQLSGGQKQRVAIAGIVALRPNVIILDEATSMLDPEGRLEVIATVKKIKEENNLTVLSITHDIDEAANANRIFVMKKGELIQEGTPEEIFSQGEKLIELGLDLPFPERLKSALKARGVDVPKEYMTEEGMVDWLWTSVLNK